MFWGVPPPHCAACFPNTNRRLRPVATPTRRTMKMLSRLFVEDERVYVRLVFYQRLKANPANLPLPQRYQLGASYHPSLARHHKHPNRKRQT